MSARRHHPPHSQLSFSLYNQLRSFIVARGDLQWMKSVCDRLPAFVLSRHNFLIDAITSDNAEMVKYLAFERNCDPRHLMRNHCSAMSFLHELSDAYLVLRLLDSVLSEDPAWINTEIKTRASLSEEEGGFCVYTATYPSFLDYWLSRDPSSRGDNNLVAALVERGANVNRISPSSVPPAFWDLLLDNGFSNPEGQQPDNEDLVAVDYFQEFDSALPSRSRFRHAGHRCAAVTMLSLFCLARAAIRVAVGGADFKPKLRTLPLPEKLKNDLRVTVCYCAA